MVESLADKSSSCSRIVCDSERRSFEAVKAAFYLDKHFSHGQG